MGHDIEGEERHTDKGVHSASEAYHVTAGAQARMMTQGIAQIRPLIALLLVSATLALFHHIFYSHLNQKSLDSAAAELPSFLRKQGGVRLVGTITAHGTRIALSGAISRTFARLFWDTIRSRKLTIPQIDALAKCIHSPFHISAPRAASASFTLFSISFGASAMALVVVVTPGSLSVSPEFQRETSCVVPTVPRYVLGPVKTEDSAPIFDISLKSLVSSSYLPPFQSDRVAASAEGAKACSYNVSFVGPAFYCVDITNETDFSPVIHPSQHPPSAPFVIWYAPNVYRPTGELLSTTIQSQDLVHGKLQATRCAAHSASYDVGIRLGPESFATVQVLSVSLNAALVIDDTFLSKYTREAVDILVGHIFAGPNGYINSTFGEVQNNAFFVTTPTGNHTWNGDVEEFLTSYMQNIFISLLSGDIHHRASKGTMEDHQYVNTTCTATFTVYEYNVARLLFAYGIALGITVVIVALGCRLVPRYGSEANIVCSQIIQATRDEGIPMASGGAFNTQVMKLDRSPPCDEDDIPEDLYPNKVNVNALGKRNDRCNPVISGAVKQSLLILAASLCVAMHHSYYRSLHGKAPAASFTLLNPMDMTRSQAAVSDIGIALAYAGQTLLSSAIYFSSTQLFWSRIRSGARITLPQIDALMGIQLNPFSPTLLLRSLRASPGVLLLSFLGALMAILSVVTPGSIVVSDNVGHAKECTVRAPRNLSALPVFSGDSAGSISPELLYRSPVVSVLSSGTYFPPLNPRASLPHDGTDHYSYNLEFIGPGLQCEDVTTSSNGSAFTIFKFNMDYGIATANLFNASTKSQPGDLDSVSIQTWDIKSGTYRAINCTAVLRSYSVLISHDAVSRIEVLDSHSVSSIRTTSSQLLPSFSTAYMHNVISTLTEEYIKVFDRGGRKEVAINFMMGNIGRFGLDGTFSWRTDLTIALEEYAQNATLSLLSGRILTFNEDDPEVLENVTTTCTYKFNAYEYAPYRLVIPYAIAVAVTTLCSISGLLAIKRNGVEESMDFSHFIRVVSNDVESNEETALHQNLMVKPNLATAGTFA